jgi:hypothetical protein
MIMAKDKPVSEEAQRSSISVLGAAIFPTWWRLVVTYADSNLTYYANSVPSPCMRPKPDFTGILHD